MFSSTEIEYALKSLGARIREARLQKGDSQQLFARRLGVSVPTLRDLEQGLPAVKVGTLAAALWALSRLRELDGLLTPTESLFQQVSQQAAKRRRAPRRKGVP